MSLELALAALRQANRIDGTRASYRKDSPSEYLAVLAYLDGGARPTGNLTLMGQGLVLVEDERRGPSLPPPPPPPGSKLSWAPPALNNPVQWTMTNANRMSNELLSGGGRDLLITSGEKLTGPVQQLHQWRHIVWIGGEIDNTPGSGNNYALPISATGTVHLEGLDIACDGDGLMTRGGAAGAIVQIQNCRVSVHIVGAEHADCFQTQGNTKLQALRFDKCTFTTDYQGIFLRLSPTSAFLNGGDFRRLNLRRRVAGQDPAQAFIYIIDEDPGVGPPQGVGNITMQDVWVECTHSSGNAVLYPGWTWQTSVAVPNLGPYSNKEGIFKLTDAIGQYVRPSTTADVVPPGGPASGQQAQSAGWTGIIRMQAGAPPGGDYCPAGTPGMAYVSPGYA
jgi:hypothetical protein